MFCMDLLMTRHQFINLVLHELSVIYMYYKKVSYGIYVKTFHCSNVEKSHRQNEYCIHIILTFDLMSDRFLYRLSQSEI